MTEPRDPLQWTDQTQLGEPVEWVRLIYVNLLRAFRQNPPPRHRDQAQDTEYQTMAEYELLRAYLNKWARLQQIDYHSETAEMWIAIPSPKSPNYRTKLTQWNTIFRRWPAFIDPEFAKEL